MITIDFVKNYFFKNELQLATSVDPLVFSVELPYPHTLPLLLVVHILVEEFLQDGDSHIQNRVTSLVEMVSRGFRKISLIHVFLVLSKSNFQTFCLSPRYTVLCSAGK